MHFVCDPWKPGQKTFTQEDALDPCKTVIFIISLYLGPNSHVCLNCILITT